MPGVPMVNNSAPINVTSKGGFSGWTSTFKFWSDASNPQQAYNIYKDVNYTTLRSTRILPHSLVEKSMPNASSK